MTKKFKDLVADIDADPVRRARVDAYREEMESEIVAYKLAELRKSQGLDQTELAERMGMTQAGISTLERSADPKLSTLTKYAKALGGTIHVSIEINGEQQELAV
jgi:DNA-binding XRE family transcriptional regulator